MAVSVLVALFLITWPKTGSTEWAVVNFTPNWNKIFIRESITMSCDVRSSGRNEYVYNWYKNNVWVHTGKNYTIEQAQYSHSGHYHCQTNMSKKSNAARLDVYNSYVILQAPFFVFEGDNVSLRCHHYPQYLARLTMFYKDNDIIRDWGSESELLIENIDMKSVWKYKCTKQVKHHFLYYQHTDEVTISVQELFMPPALKLKEGEHMTLTCDTSLSPDRQTTELEFAFYRDGQIIQEFSPFDKVIIPSFLLEDSGTYMCQVRATASMVEKASSTLYIKGKRKGEFGPVEITATKQSLTKDQKALITLFPLSLAVILLLSIVALSIYRRRIHNNPHPQTDLPMSFNDPDGQEKALKNDIIHETLN